jgi:hypothetical protein
MEDRNPGKVWVEVGCTIAQLDGGFKKNPDSSAPDAKTLLEYLHERHSSLD